MSDAISKAVVAMDMARSAVGPFHIVVMRELTEAIDALQALQHSGEPVVFTCHGNNAPAYGCNKPGDMSGTYYKAPQPPTTKPIAAIKGWFHGECVVQAFDPAAVLPAGMALYAAPQSVVPEGSVIIESGDLEHLQAWYSGRKCERLNSQDVADRIARIDALLTAGKGGEQP